MSSPELSVVVLSRNETAYLRLIKDELQATPSPRSEIVIVDDGSTFAITRYFIALT